MFIPLVRSPVDPHLYPSLTTLRAELTLYTFLEAFLDNPVTTESSLPFLISIVHYFNQKHRSDFFIFHACKITKDFRGEEKEGQGQESRVEFG